MAVRSAATHLLILDWRQLYGLFAAYIDYSDYSKLRPAKYLGAVRYKTQKPVAIAARAPQV